MNALTELGFILKTDPKHKETPEIVFKALGITLKSERISSLLTHVYQQGKSLSGAVMKMIKFNRDIKDQENRQLAESMSHRKRALTLRKEVQIMRRTSGKLLQPIFTTKVRCDFVHPERSKRVKIDHDLIQDHSETKGKLDPMVYGKITLDPKSYEHANGWHFPRELL